MFSNVYFLRVIDSLPHNRILNLSKLKAFSDGKLNMTQKLKFILGRVENILGNGENVDYQHFLLFSQCFQKATFSGLSKEELCGKNLKLNLVNPFPNKPWFLHVCFSRLPKTLREKEKLLLMSNFSFSQSVFYPFWRTFRHFHQI